MSNVTSYNTAISRKNPSAPLRFLEKNGYINGSVIDYGCGKGADGRFLTSLGYSAVSYDPHWNPVDIAGKSFDTVLCTYVLNVVNKTEEKSIIESIREILSPKGKAFLSVRRDLSKEGKTSRGFQRNVLLGYNIIKENSSFCIYEINNNKT